jgi:hypothetical protein
MGNQRLESDDVIIKTKKGFLLKSDEDKQTIINTLKNLITGKKINNFAETNPYTRL